MHAIKLSVAKHTITFFYPNTKGLVEFSEHAAKLTGKRAVVSRIREREGFGKEYIVVGHEKEIVKILLREEFLSQLPEQMLLEPVEDVEISEDDLPEMYEQEEYHSPY